MSRRGRLLYKEDMMTIIKNGTIVDGTGAPAFVGDVLVEGDRIVDVVATPNSPTSQFSNSPTSQLSNPQPSTIDATGCLVTPGFIDAHTHSDAYLVIEPDAPSKISQGITTEVNGQCGGSVAPRYGEARLSSDWASLLGDRLTWHSLAEYRAVLAAAKPAVNTVQFIGHNTLRSSVVGYAGRAATPDEQRRMEYLLAQSLDEGGWGLTTGLIYQPGKYSTPAEVEALAKVAAAKGGLYATHMRSEGDRILEAIDEVIHLAETTGIRCEISHLKTSYPQNWGKLDAVFEKIEGAMKAGHLLGSDRYPYCGAGTDLDVVFPDWAGEGGCPAECKRLADPATRARIVAEINAQPRDWSTVMIGGTWHPETKACSGKTVSQLCGGEGAPAPNVTTPVSKDALAPNVATLGAKDAAKPWGGGALAPNGAKDAAKPWGGGALAPARTPGDLVCTILAKDLCRTGAFFFTMSETNLDRILAKPWIVPGSDASLRAPWGPLGADHPHPRAYATMPEFYRRVRALGISREETIARMTSVVANRFGIRDRGVLRKGAYADLLIWKESEFKAQATYLKPHRFTTGVKLAMVNGGIPYRDGEFTHSRTGRFLER